MTPHDIDKEKAIENQITCPHCKRTLSNDSVIDSDGKESGLMSTFVYYECGEKITFRAIIAQLSDQKYQRRESMFNSTNEPWLEG